MKAAFFIDKLQLKPHPEGGYYKEVHRSDDIISFNCLSIRYNGDRCAMTSIYYLLEKANKSHFHKVNSDETWHYYEGNSSIELLIILPSGKIQRVKIGRQIEKGECFQFTVPKNCWFAAHLIDKTGFALVGCTVAPGFEFSDFHLGKARELKAMYPGLDRIIDQFCIEKTEKA